MVSLAAKITLALALFSGWFGFVLPYMISSTNSFLVIAGFLLTTFCIIGFVVMIVREVLGISYESNSRKRRHH